MELTEIKNGFFGYNKTDVCRYITEMNEKAKSLFCFSIYEISKNNFALLGISFIDFTCFVLYHLAGVERTT